MSFCHNIMLKELVNKYYLPIYTLQYQKKCNNYEQFIAILFLDFKKKVQ